MTQLSRESFQPSSPVAPESAAVAAAGHKMMSELGQLGTQARTLLKDVESKAVSWLPQYAPELGSGPIEAGNVKGKPGVFESNKDPHTVHNDAATKSGAGSAVPQYPNRNLENAKKDPKLSPCQMPDFGILGQPGSGGNGMFESSPPPANQPPNRFNYLPTEVPPTPKTEPTEVFPNIPSREVRAPGSGPIEHGPVLPALFEHDSIKGLGEVRIEDTPPKARFKY